jgi:phosphate transport system protein
MAETRIHFHDDLRALEQQTLGALDMVADSLERTLEALVRQDLELAQAVMLDDDRLDGRYLEVHQRILSLIARQAPVATDLRLAAALLDVIKEAERMGDQCVNVAKLVTSTGTSPHRDGDLVAKIVRMGEVAESLIRQAKEAFSRRDVSLAQDLVRQDDELDRLNRECFRLAVAHAGEDDEREWAMFMMLVARWLERLGDHAVDIGEQAAFVVTGLFREFEDASHPFDSPSRATGPEPLPPA